MNRHLLALILLAIVVSPGCRLFRRAPKPQPTPPQPRVMQPIPEVKSDPKPLPPPPEIPVQVEVTQEPAPPPEEDFPGPPRRRPVPPKPKPAETVAVPEQPPPPMAMPQIGQILSPEEQQAYNSAIDRNLERAQRIAGVLASRRLNRQQATTLERVKAFMQQAQETRRTDPARAATLAERAAVLAEDLLQSVQ